MKLDRAYDLLESLMDPRTCTVQFVWRQLGSIIDPCLNCNDCCRTSLLHEYECIVDAKMILKMVSQSWKLWLKDPAKYPRPRTLRDAGRAFADKTDSAQGIREKSKYWDRLVRIMFCRRVLGVEVYGWARTNFQDKDGEKIHGGNSHYAIPGVVELGDSFKVVCDVSFE
jgi:hypothetical protein